jgi:hypothetical protein
MRSFPTGPEFTGLNAPIGAEYELEELPVEGRIPAEIAGTFFRAIPDPAFPPYIEDGAAVISGDGMVSALRFAPGRVSFAIRYVQTERHKAELAAGRALFGKYRNPFTDRPEAAGLDRTVANTTPVWHAAVCSCARRTGARIASTRTVSLPWVSPRFRRALAKRNGYRARAHRSAERRAFLLRLRGRWAGVYQGVLLHRRPAGKPHPRAMVRCPLLRDDARLHGHRAPRTLPDLPDHLQPGTTEGGRRSLGARVAA